MIKEIWKTLFSINLFLAIIGSVSANELDLDLLNYLRFKHLTSIENATILFLNGKAPNSINLKNTNQRAELLSLVAEEDLKHLIEWHTGKKLEPEMREQVFVDNDVYKKMMGYRLDDGTIMGGISAFNFQKDKGPVGTLYRKMLQECSMGDSVGHERYEFETLILIKATIKEKKDLEYAEKIMNYLRSSSI